MPSADALMVTASFRSTSFMACLQLRFAPPGRWRRVSSKPGAATGPGLLQEPCTRVSPRKAQALQRPVARPRSYGRIAKLPPRYAPEAARPLCGLAANRRRSTPGLRARRLRSQPSFAFPLQGGSSCSLAAEHLLDVCSLSGRERHPYPTRYSRPSLLPASCPAQPTDPLAVHLPAHAGDWSGFPRSAS
jgi:hypothetical protein